MSPFYLQILPTGRRDGSGKPTFNVVLNNKVVGELFYNMTGYTGAYMPLPDGGRLALPERAISAWKREVSKLNNEARRIAA